MAWTSWSTVLSDGGITQETLRRRGLAVFTTPFNTLDGYGDGPFAYETETMDPGSRPTLQGNGLSLLVNGLDAQSCNECRSIVKHSARPPILGIGGVGGIVQNALVSPSVIDLADSMDDRVAFASSHDPELPMAFDGKADFNGPYSNPPFLFGGGGIELLAKEITADLQQALAVARAAETGSVTELNTHGVDFGHIKSLGAGRWNFTSRDRLQGQCRADARRSFGGPALRSQGREILDARFRSRGHGVSFRDSTRGGGGGAGGCGRRWRRQRNDGFRHERPARFRRHQSRPLHPALGLGRPTGI